MKAKVNVTQSCSTLCDPLDCTLSDPSAHGDSQDKNTGGLPCPPPGSFQPKNGTQVSHIAGRFFTTGVTREAPGISIH